MKNTPSGISANLDRANTMPRLAVDLPTPIAQPTFTEYTKGGVDVALPTLTLFPVDRGKGNFVDSD